MDNICILPERNRKLTARPVLQVLGLLLLLVLFQAFPALAFDQQHKLFSQELKKYVNKDGMVNYALWKKKQQGLNQYLQSLSKLSPDEYKQFSRLEKRALWLNAYNALAIKLVLDHYPIKARVSEYPSPSIRQIPDTWDAIKSTVAGQEVSLYTIVHDKLRKAKDPRTHFAVVPAARGGGVLQKRAFRAETVVADLGKLTGKFMSKKENLSLDADRKTITVSQIFRWFPLDFIQANELNGPVFQIPRDDDVVKSYVWQFLTEKQKRGLDQKEVRVIYAPYDWLLNEAGKHN